MSQSSNQTPQEVARATYEKTKRDYKRVSFNTDSEKDRTLIEHTKTLQPSFSEWVKNKLQEDINKNK